MSSSAQRTAFTLLETLITLGMLVALAALFLPAIMSSRNGDDLELTADNFRALFAALRFRAIDEGRRYTVRFNPGGNTFAIEVPPDDGSTPPPEAPLEDAVNPEGQTVMAVDLEPLEYDSGQLIGVHRLPDGIRWWADGQASASNSPSTAPSAMVTAGRGSASTRSSASAVIDFYPDGTATEMRFGLMDERQTLIRFRVRGITGTVTMQKPENIQTGNAVAASSGGQL